MKKLLTLTLMMGTVLTLSQLAQAGCASKYQEESEYQYKIARDTGTSFVDASGKPDRGAVLFSTIPTVGVPLLIDVVDTKATIKKGRECADIALAIGQSAQGDGTIIRRLRKDVQDKLGKKVVEKSDVANVVMDLDANNELCLGSNLLSYKKFVALVAETLSRK